jgi:preprotein translocase subunit SecB
MTQPTRDNSSDQKNLVLIDSNLGDASSFLTGEIPGAEVIELENGDLLKNVLSEAEIQAVDLTEANLDDLSQILSSSQDITNLHLITALELDELQPYLQVLTQSDKTFSNDATVYLYQYLPENKTLNLQERLLLDNSIPVKTEDNLVVNIEPATVTTDKDDYPPGATAIITGENFDPGEIIELQVLHTDGIPNTGGGHEPWQVTDGGEGDLDGIVDGNFETTWYVNPDDSANSAFELTATGLSSGEIATHNFTDSTIFAENFDPTTNTWTVNPNGTDNATTSATGRWDIGDPVGHSRFGSTAFEELEAYNGTNALVTGISGSSSEVARTSGSATDAVTTIKSSNFTLSNSPNFNTLDFRYYLSTNDTSSVTGTDSFKVELVRASDNTVLSTLLNAVHAHKASSTLTRTGAWGLASTSLDAYAGQTAYLRLTATDANNNSILEAGIDAVNVTSLDKSTLYTANEKYSLGNRIWNDANNNGSFDTGEAGINSVVVNLYKDSNNDGTPDGGIIATDTTSNGGYYRFDNLLADNYIVEVAASNFNTGNPLAGLISSSIDEADPDSNVDKNDNGVGTASSPTNGIRSRTVTLGSSYVEPTGETELEPLSFSTVSVTAADTVASSPSIYVNAIDGANRGRVVEAGTYFDAFNVDVTGYGNDFTGFCIEFAEFVTPGTFTPVNATASGPYYNSSYNDSSDISNFFGVDPNASNYGIVTQAELNLISTVWYNKQSTLKTNVNDAAAMQALIWELQNDQIFDLSSGNFYLDPNAGTNSTTLTNTNNTKTTVETWVNNFNTGTWTGSLPLAILTVEDNQDIIVNLDLGVGSTDSQSNLTADFGFTNQIDYGDAPDTSAGTGAGNYTTTAANGGPSHGIITGLSLGSTIDEDNGTLQNTAATADDTTNNGATDDEDGITSFSTLRTDDGSYSVTVNVNNTLGSNAKLVGWIDFDQSGTFDADEAQIISNINTSGNQTLTWNGLPSDIKAGTTYARFRLSTDAALTTSYSTGAASNGEVEDYQLTVTGVDYGDAPDTGAGTGTGNYETTNKTGTANDGASHTIVSGLSLGSTVDADLGTLQNSTATADDTNGTDDEDGVTLTSIRTDNGTYSVTVDVNNTTAIAANLLGWIDFNQDGIFQTTEAASTIETVAANSGATTKTLTWSSLPSDIKAGTTYARFRLSTDTLTTSSSTGALGNGEVEDYQLTVTGVDYGDAPDTGPGTEAGNYETTNKTGTANDGPSHTIVSGLSLGSTVDGDTGSLQDPTATADDTTNNGSTDDEDGITSFSTLRTDDGSYSVTVNVNNTLGSNAKLVGWIDFDQSGTFDADEAQIISNINTSGNQTLTWNGLPSDIKAGTTYTRFRLSTDAALTTSYSTGAATSGEVEDYQLTVTGVDYGDAPDTTAGNGSGDYTTTAANGGASHTIVSGLSIGGTIDGDNSILQNTGATADDTTNNGATDDEDGISSFNTLRTDDSTYTVTVNVNNTTGTDANLLGWIDFNQDGIFQTTEAASTVETVAANSGATTQTLTWNTIPSNIKAGATYARFRLSTDTLTDADSTGALGNGEVEDHQFTVTGVDYGDAPDTTGGNGSGDYTTTAANGGASHFIVSGLSLGSTVDGDTGSLQNTGATADDTTNNGATDDEDGISSFNTLRTDDSTYTVTVNVNNTTGTDANLLGWIDFNQDGIFQTTEAASTVETVAANSGATTQTLTWNTIPSNIKAGATYARFRLSTDTLTDADSTGALGNGEVEDYQLTVINSINGNEYSEVLTGTSNDDIITGDEGQDTLTGGAGEDQFFYSKTSEGLDIITDFDTNGDLLDFRGIVTNELGGASNPFGDGYVKAVSFGSHTMIQVDFDASGSLLPKDVVLLENVDSTTINASDFIFS